MLTYYLNVGTNNEKRSKDEFYIGLIQKRATGQEFYEFLHEFIKAMKQNYGEKNSRIGDSFCGACSAISSLKILGGINYCIFPRFGFGLVMSSTIHMHDDMLLAALPLPDPLPLPAPLLLSVPLPLPLPAGYTLITDEVSTHIELLKLGCWLKLCGILELSGWLKLGDLLELGGWLKLGVLVELSGWLKLGGLLELSGWLKLGGLLELSGWMKLSGLLELGGWLKLDGLLELGGWLKLGGLLEFTAWLELPGCPIPS
ncbi:hypothetical protein BC332_13638 [Capsicum chinense]|nr:hypothetical protein BC332_13638 [Capsicum chinense]